jgi:hypothetical protein
MAVTKAKAVYLVSGLEPAYEADNIVAADLGDDSVAHVIPLRLIQRLSDGTLVSL